MIDWHVLYLRPRCEKKLGDFCTIHGIPHYLPLRVETKVYQRRKVTVQKPVFPSYFFASLDEAARVDVLKTNHVLRVLSPVSSRALLHDLAQIRKALRVDPELRACSALSAGRRVRILGGPFRGIEGMIQLLKGQTRVMLNVDIVGQAVSVEVDREYLELVD